MKKTMFIILLIITALLIISCPQNIVKGTVWEGTIKGTLGGLADDDENDLEAYFNPNNEMIAYITYKTGGNKETLKAKGTYTLGNNHALTAKLEGERGGTEFDVELTGVINYYTGQGSGEYEFNVGVVEFEDEWDLMKIGSN